MKFLVSLFAISSLFQTLTCVSISAPLANPARDDFYTPTPGFEYTEPGTILKIRPTPREVRNLLFFHVPLKNSWQLLVRSHDSFGNPNAIVTTILEPHNSDPSKIISYQTFEDSTALKCSPSYNFQIGLPFGNLAVQSEMKFIVPALRKGYIVISPDYEGPQGAFAAGFQAGHAVLDSIRGVLRSGNISSIPKDAKVVMWGYSGGALASSWATVLQPTYAPELAPQLLGTALGGFVTNITAVAEASDGTVISGLLPLALNGLANEYPIVRELLNQEINPRRNASFQRGIQKCLIPAVIHFRGRKILGSNNDKKAFFPNGWDLLSHSQFYPIVEKNSLISFDGLPKIPIFVYHGTLDKVVPIKDVHNIYEKWCNQGIESFEFAEAVASGHVLETFTGAVAAWTWIQKRFDGVQAYDGCFHTKRLTNVKYKGASKSTIDYYESLLDDKSIALLMET